MYQDVQLFIGGEWSAAAEKRTLPVLNPATEETLATVACAGRADLERAVESAVSGFALWRKKSAYERSRIMRKAAGLLRERADDIGLALTLEQGKPLPEAKLEVMVGADVIEWFAEEARRTYGRVIPARAENVSQIVLKEPIGPVAAFSPWNFPINQAVRKISCALAAGCSIVIKGPEETPASCALLVQAFVDAGVTPGAINLVFGVPSEISNYLIAHEAIRKVTFTGSTAVGKMLAELAGRHMKRATMELGGHAPAIVFEDADVDAAARLLAGAKYRNAGQVCISPTRFLVQESAYDAFLRQYVSASKEVKVGDGREPGVTMGPLAHARRIQAMEELVGDAVRKGAKVATGGARLGNKGYFFEPTVLTDVPLDARIMNEEPFGPVTLVRPFRTFDDAVAEANRLAYALASYAYTRSERTATKLSSAIESGMLSINHHGLALPETPFGGIKDSGYGSEGGLEALESYLNTKFITHASV